MAQLTYGTPGINPAAPDPRPGFKSPLEILQDALPGVFGSPAPRPETSAPSYWDTLWDVLLGDLYGQGRPESRPAPGAQPSDPHFQPPGRPVSPQEQDRQSPGFCFGFDKELCAGVGLGQNLCLWVSNLACLLIGLVILLALLGLGVRSLL
jgi:hypothetical protein